MSNQRIGNDSIYGMGNDGNVTISSNTALSRDMYYNNLTINSNIHLNTNGFRIFVKGTLTLDGSVGIKSTDSVSNGTVISSIPASSNVSNSIGGNAFSNTYTASSIPASILNDISVAITGYYIDPSGNTVIVNGGAGGGAGSAGTVTPAANGSGAGAGQVGGLSLRGQLQPGGYGSPGSNGVAGSTPPAASGGAGGAGGGVVIIAAKTISGSGTIFSQGKGGSAGGGSATGTGATNGASGTSAPSATLHHHVDGTAYYPYPNTDSSPVGSVSSPNLPHGGHVPHIYNYYYGYTYRYVHYGNTHHCEVSGHYNHGYNVNGHHNNPHHYGGYHTPQPATSSYFAINGIPHTYPHRPHSGVAFSGYNTHYSGNFNYSGVYYPHYTVHIPAGGYPHVPAGHHHCLYPVEYHDNSYGEYIYRNAGTASHSGSATYPGGAGGTAGTNGTNGSTTAGGYGQSGGGGGIIIVTDTSSINVTTNTAGGTANGNTASSGSVITVLNQ